MARIRYNELLRGLEGAFGELVFKKRGKRFYISRRPDFSKRKLSAGQREQINLFRDAVKFAQRVKEDPIARAPYEPIARNKGLDLYHTILGEYIRNGRSSL